MALEAPVVARSASASIFGSGWLDILGSSEAAPTAPAAPPKPRAAPAARPFTDETGALIDLSDLQPSLPNPVAPASIGCGFNSDTRTVIVSGNYEGDTTRLDVVLEQSSEIASVAQKHNNRVVYAFLGNAVPDVHSASSESEESDSLLRLLDLKKTGIAQRGVAVAPSDVALLVGGRELGWLRLANVQPSTRELASPSDAGALAVLKRPSPFSGATGAHGWASWAAHDAAVSTLFSMVDEAMDSHKLSVLMFGKLTSIAARTMRAPGMVQVFVRRQRLSERVDQVSLGELHKFVQNHDGTIEKVIELLFTEAGELTIEGFAIAPACRHVVEAVLHYARGPVMDYLRSASLIHVVHNGYSRSPDGALWLFPSGTDEGKIVGKLPAGVDAASMQVRYVSTDAGRIEWKDRFNGAFQSFLSDFATGTFDHDLFCSYVCMSVAGGTTSGRDLLPLSGLRDSPRASLRGVVASESSAFGTITRRVLVDPKRTDHVQNDVVSVLEEWSNTNTDAFTPSTYFAIASYCGGTKGDLRRMSTPPPLDLSESLCSHLYRVSMTLAALLSVKVGDVTVGEFGIDRLLGQLGPVVWPAAGQKQSMRAVFFEHESLDTAFVALLPEAFVRHALSYQLVDYAAGDYYNPMIAVSGFIALPSEAAVPITFDNLTESAQQQLDRDLSDRLWALKRKRSNGTLTPFSIDDYTAIAAMKSASNTYTNTTGHMLVRTLQTDADPLAGLHIGVRAVPGMARVTIDSDCSDMHSLFRVVSNP